MAARRTKPRKSPTSRAAGFSSRTEPLGARLKTAAGEARGDWLMFLSAGAVPGTTWIDEAIAFAEKTGADARAAVFAGEAGFAATLRRALFLPSAQQGLILRKSFYDALGGHRADSAAPEQGLLRRIGRRRLTTLRTPVIVPDI